MKPTFIRSCTLAARLCLWGPMLGTIPFAQATITVSNLNDSGPGSLRQAIADASPGDSINFTVNGTITLTSGELVITNDLTISGPGRTNLTVSGNNASRVFNINSASAVVVMSGLAIIDGNPGVDNGGGIMNLGNLTISNCIVSHCTAVMAGAGILSDNSSTLRVINSIVSNNSCWSGGAWGAGIACPWYNIHLTVINSTISSNYNPTAGGAIMLGNGGVGAITNSTFSGNSAGGYGNPYFGTGGGIYLQYATSLSLDSCTISGNTAGEYGGGGIANYGGFTVIRLRNSVVAGNNANTGPDCSGPITSLDYNLIQDTNGATITGATVHNIYGKDPLLGPLADNGGPTVTHALLPGSPAIDQGSSGGLTTDQRGQPRVFNFPAYFDADDGSDIGAYEVQESTQTGPVFTVNSNDDADDGIPGIAHCSLREAINAANANADTNTIDFAAEVPGLHTGVTGTITLTNGQLSIAKSVNINGPGAANLTVSGYNTNRVLNVTANNTVNLFGLTIANGKPNSDGGGIRTSNAVLTVIGCTISNCSASVGGGIRNYFGAVTLKNCLLTGNYGSIGSKSGGAIFNDRGTVTLLDTTLSGNAGDVGGAIWNYVPPSVVVIRNSLISSNIAVNGGGIRNEGVLAVTNSTFSGNSADVGGALHNYYTTAASSATTAYLDSCTITANFATNVGGGVATGSVPPKPQPTTKVHNSILAGNTCPFGPDVFGIINSLDYNLIQNTNGCTVANSTTHNIYNQDPKLGPLADLGGPTPTHALRFDSPAIDAGNSSGLATDQRGLPRPIDDLNTPNAAGSDGSDIGAYETDPILRLTGIEKAGQDIRLGFSSMLGRTYRLESTDNLAGTWSVLTNGMPGTGTLLQAIDAGGATQPHRFYRAALDHNLFADSFDAGNADGWTAFDSALAVTNGALELQSASWGDDARAVAGDAAWSNYCFEVDFMIADNPENSAWPASILFRVTEIASGLDVGKYYQVSLGPNRVGIERIGGGSASGLAVTYDVAIPTQAWHHLRLVVQGNRASVSIDGALVLSCSGLDAYPTGRVGLKAINEGKMLFDNAQVWGL